MYLMKYGYMDHHHKSNKSAPLLSRDGLRDYVMKFQGFAGRLVEKTWTPFNGSFRPACDRRAGQQDSETDEGTEMRSQGRCRQEYGVKEEQAIRAARLQMESENSAVQNL